MKEQENGIEKLRTRVFNMVSVGVVDDPINQGYDIVSTTLLLINIFVSFAMTFEDFYKAHSVELKWIEAVTVLFFAIDYFLRLFAAPRMYPDKTPGKAMLSYVFSGYGIIDLMSFLPYYLPWFFPAGATVFRLFRVARIFRLFRINAYYDSLGVIGRVLIGKKNQILASIFIIVMLIMASSLCMYSVEHEAQPDVFKNAFSGMWWATSTMLTVGYGDIYPITVPGQILGILLAFLGVGLVAIPTGIISAGFVEEYQKVKRLQDIEKEEAIHFIEIELKSNDRCTGKMIKELGMPRSMLIATIIRDGMTIIPRGSVVLCEGDKLIICAESVKDDYLNELKEIELRRNHHWNGKKIKELDISRQSFIVLIDRKGKMLIPDGELTLREGDKVLLYSKESKQKLEDFARF